MKLIPTVFAGAMVLSGWASAATTLGLKNFRELPAAYSQVLGVSPASPDIKLVLKKVQSRLPQKGEIEELSSPTLLAIYELAGGYCSNFVDAEAAKPAAERILFKEVDFKGTLKQFTPALQKGLLQNFSESFWFRSPTMEEAKEIETFLADSLTLSTVGASGVREISFLLCTYFGTSVQFLLD